MSTIRIIASDPATQGAFVTINISDFDPAKHEPFDQAAVDALRAAPAASLPKVVDGAHAELEHRHEQLEAQAARQREQADQLDAEAARQAEQADILAAERARLQELAKSIELAGAAFAPPGGKDPEPGALIEPESPEAAAAVTKIDKSAKAKK